MSEITVGLIKKINLLFIWENNRKIEFPDRWAFTNYVDKTGKVLKWYWKCQQYAYFPFKSKIIPSEMSNRDR